MNEETKMTPGEKLKKFRGKKTIREVADAVGVSESAYIKYERGERNPSDPTKLKLAEYFGRSVGFIFFE